MYIHAPSGRYPYSFEQLRRDNPTVSFPKEANPELLAAYGMFPVQQQARPAIDEQSQTCNLLPPVLSEGNWIQEWEVTDLEPATVAANLAAAKLNAWLQIKAERDRRKSGGVLVSGKWYHSDVDSRIQQLGLVMMGASVPSVQWKTMDGTFVTMSQVIANAIFQGAANLDMTLFSVAEAHRLAMEASADPATYDFSANWPAQFV